MAGAKKGKSNKAKAVELSSQLDVTIETPKGSRNKFDFDEERGRFVLGGVLPAGAVFPYDFGFVPSTRGEDGDPLDVLILMDEPAFAGCVVPSRLIGVIEAEQTERDGATMRNDRFIAVADNSHNHSEVHSLEDVSQNLLDEIEHFFVSYNEIKGKNFHPLARSGPEHAAQLVAEGAARFVSRSTPGGHNKKSKKSNPKKK